MLIRQIALDEDYVKITVVVIIRALKEISQSLLISLVVFYSLVFPHGLSKGIKYVEFDFFNIRHCFNF